MSLPPVTFQDSLTNTLGNVKVLSALNTILHSLHTCTSIDFLTCEFPTRLTASITNFVVARHSILNFPFREMALSTLSYLRMALLA